jgi:hypothetical protein
MAFSLMPALADAQIVESVGGRALGMGGAFVALADDTSATWWNPAGLAAGPFVEVGLGWSSTDTEGSLPARERVTAIAAGIPPFGISYYRLRITDIGPFRTIADDGADREDRRATVPDWSLSASQLGATLVHSLMDDFHVGTTLKYVRTNGLRDDGTSGDVHNAFDMDLGVLALYGPLRFGGVVRNLLETELGVAKVPRQARVGVAFDTEKIGKRPVMLALDADLAAYSTVSGDRRVVAAGGETWMFGRRLGVRAGARFNTTAAEQQALTAGASVAVRSRIFVDGHVVFGGADDESGWGVAARASF